MSLNRILGFDFEQRTVAAPAGPSGSFRAFPIGLSPWQEAIYRAAYEQARAQLETPRRRALRLECWN